MLVVGVYCTFLSRFVNSPFVFGVTKHALGYVAGMHSWFCQCRHVGKHASVSWGKLASESIFEGLAVVGLCSFLGRTATSFFVIGMILHLGSELSGFHKDFMKRCHM